MLSLVVAQGFSPDERLHCTVYWNLSNLGKFLPLVLPPTVLGFYLLMAIGGGSFIGRWYKDIFNKTLAFSFQGLVAGIEHDAIMSTVTVLHADQFFKSLIDREEIDGLRLQAGDDAVLEAKSSDVILFKIWN